MESYDIIILAGQSNAEGYGVGEVSEEYEKDERVLFLSDRASAHFVKDENGKDVLRLNLPSEMQIRVADETTGEQGKVGKLALLFSKKYIENGLLVQGRKLLIINAAVGGTGFARNEWGVNGILYKRLCFLTDYALSQSKNGRITAFLWHQGECDSVENAEYSFEKRYETHKNNLTTMFEDFTQRYAEQIQNNKLPMIAGGFCDEWYLKNKTPCDAVLRAIREVFEKYGGAFVETQGLLSNNQKTKNGDDIHFCRESLHILGARYFEAFECVKKKELSDCMKEKLVNKER